MPNRNNPTPEESLANARERSLTLTPMERLRNVIDALCEEPFESEANQEDIVTERAALARLAQRYADNLFQASQKVTPEDGSSQGSKKGPIVP
jgi:hypothetical protein